MSLSVSILHPASQTAPTAARKTLTFTHAPPFLLIETQPRHPRQHR